MKKQEENILSNSLKGKALLEKRSRNEKLKTALKNNLKRRKKFKGKAN